MLITDNWRWIIYSLSRNSESFVVHYNRKEYPWIFVESPKATIGQPVINDIGKRLLDQKVLIPIVEDEEYKIQYAIGTMDCRIYKLSLNVDIEKLLKLEQCYEF